MAEISPSAFFNIWIFFTDKEEKNERKNTHTKKRRKKSKERNFQLLNVWIFFTDKEEKK